MGTYTAISIDHVASPSVAVPIVTLELKASEVRWLKHYSGYAALHVGYMLRALGAGDFWNAQRNHEMSMEAIRLAVEGVCR